MASCTQGLQTPHFTSSWHVCASQNRANAANGFHPSQGALSQRVSASDARTSPNSSWFSLPCSCRWRSAGLGQGFAFHRARLPESRRSRRKGDLGETVTGQEAGGPSGPCAMRHKSHHLSDCPSWSAGGCSRLGKIARATARGLEKTAANCRAPWASP